MRYLLLGEPRSAPRLLRCVLMPLGPPAAPPSAGFADALTGTGAAAAAVAAGALVGGPLLGDAALGVAPAGAAARAGDSIGVFRMSLKRDMRGSCRPKPNL